MLSQQPERASCRRHRPEGSNPLVAYCLTGALRTFPEPRIFSSIRENLIDSFSSRSVVFVVVSFDCRVSTYEVHNSTHHRPVTKPAPCHKDYATRDLDRALAYVGAESFEVVPNRLPPPVNCPAAPDLERYPGYWYQQDKTSRCLETVERHERSTGVCFDWVVRARP